MDVKEHTRLVIDACDNFSRAALGNMLKNLHKQPWTELDNPTLLEGYRRAQAHMELALALHGPPDLNDCALNLANWAMMLRQRHCTSLGEINPRIPRKHKQYITNGWVQVGDQRVSMTYVLGFVVSKAVPGITAASIYCQIGNHSTTIYCETRDEALEVAAQMTAYVESPTTR